MTRPWIVIITLISIMPCAVSTSHAQDSTEGSPAVGGVVLVSMTGCCPDEAWPEAERALVDELAVLDIPVIVASGAAIGDRDRRRELEVLAQSRDAAAAMRIVRPEEGMIGGVELWLTDRVTGKTIFRHLAQGDSRGKDAATIIAVRAVDTLRASLLELRIRGRRQPEVEPSVAIAELAEDTPLETDTSRTVGIAARGVVLGSPGGARARGGFAVGLGWHPATWGGVELDGLWAPLGRDISTSEASSSIDVALLRGWFVWHVRDEGFARPSLALGGGALFVWGEGLRADNAPLRSDYTVVGYGGIAARLDLVFTERLRLFLGGRVGLAIPEVRLFHGTQEAASLGRPLMEGSLGLEIRIP